MKQNNKNFTTLRLCQQWNRWSSPQRSCTVQHLVKEPQTFVESMFNFSLFSHFHSKFKGLFSISGWATLVWEGGGASDTPGFFNFGLIILLFWYMNPLIITHCTNFACLPSVCTTPHLVKSTTVLHNLIAKSYMKPTKWLYYIIIILIIIVLLKYICRSWSLLHRSN
jgi:hypothetical protein